VKAGAANSAAALPPPGQRIALAADAAFTFVYAHLLDSWRRAGAEISAFSPLADEAPPEECDVCWLPGGYPELHAGQLAAAQRFRRGLPPLPPDRAARRRSASGAGSRTSPRAGRCTASAAATWCLAKGSRTRMACAMP